jgi:hypothetical protein
MYAMALLPFVMLESVCLVQKSNLSVLKNASIFEMLTMVEHAVIHVLARILYVKTGSARHVLLGILVVLAIVLICKRTPSIAEHVTIDALTPIPFV